MRDKRPRPASVPHLPTSYLWGLISTPSGCLHILKLGCALGLRVWVEWGQRELMRKSNGSEGQDGGRSGQDALHAVPSLDLNKVVR